MRSAAAVALVAVQFVVDERRQRLQIAIGFAGTHTVAAFDRTVLAAS